MDIVLANRPDISNSYIDDFIDRLKKMSLEFDSEDLRSFGITNDRQMEKAVDRAKFTCSLSGLDLSWHFRDYYIGTTGELRHAWKLSKLAFLLAFYKADPLKRDTALLQTEIITDLQKDFEIRVL